MGKTVLDSGWLAARSTDVKLSGIQLTTTCPPGDASHPWMHASVPGTVLCTLLKNKLVPDPFYGIQNEAIIDIAVSGREYYTFWFFTSFHCKLLTNQHVELNFRGVNYSGEAYINGHKKLLPKGMFRRHSLDVTGVLNPEGQNLLAVLVNPPDHPGSIPLAGGQGGDHEIGKDVATQYVEGWDWMAPIRDRNTGIWDEVSLTVTGPVKIVDPHMVSTFFDDYKRVYLHTTTELENKSSWIAECDLTVEVTSELEGNICLVEHSMTRTLTIPASKRVEYTFPELFFYKPNLWWPNGKGKQALYNVTITVNVRGYGESDAWSHLHGFRKIESHIDSNTGGRLFKVNGQPIFIRGGNWILSDGLLRLSRKRYQTDIKFHADMNLNMIRCWGGGLAERPEFYHFCDIYGILVWQEFWITGDVDGRGDPVSNPDGPLDHDLFLFCARDTIKLLRNHASLALWVGGNEQVPPPDINEALKSDLKLHPHFENDGSNQKLHQSPKDPSQYLDGSRLYVQGSMWDGFADGKGNFTDGPYEIQYPESFFRDDFYNYGFNPEVGSVGLPVAATIRATMPPEGWQIPIFRKLSSGYVEEVPNPIWAYHKYIPYSKPGKVHDQILDYGVPTDLDDFCLKAQLVNYVQYKALLEGWSSRMWDKFTGALIWKTQNPWTGLRGQFYDHCLDQTAGFYGCRCAAEPIHIQLNLASSFIEIVNTTSEELSNVAIEASVWDLEGTCPYFKVFDKLSVLPQKVTTIAEMKYPKSRTAKPVYFLLLKLYNISDYGIISRNFYWLHIPGADYNLLEQYRQKRVPLELSSKVSVRGSTYEVAMKVHNGSKKTDSTLSTSYNNIVTCSWRGDFDMDSLEGGTMKEEKCHSLKSSLISRIRDHFLVKDKTENVSHINGSEDGVAFFLHFSVNGFKPGQKSGEDTRILPVHYSDNYFSLIPGETMTIKITFEAPAGATPRITLRGWNYNHDHSVLLS